MDVVDAGDLGVGVVIDLALVEAVDVLHIGKAGGAPVGVAMGDGVTQVLAVVGEDVELDAYAAVVAEDHGSRAGLGEERVTLEDLQRAHMLVIDGIAGVVGGKGPRGEEDEYG